MFTQTLSAGQTYIYYSGVYANSNVNGSYTIRATQSIKEISDEIMSKSDDEIITVAQEILYEHGNSSFAEVLRPIIASLNAGNKVETANKLRQELIHYLNTDTLNYINSSSLNDFSSSNLEDVTRALIRALIANPINNLITKNGWFKELFRLAGFVRTKDLNGTYIYHATMDCLQQYAGYNDFYDVAFNLGTDMSKDYFQFNSGGVEYRLWVWKGDYLNLGAGSELGIYKQSKINGQWDVDTTLTLHMTLKLSLNSRTIVNWDPKKDDNYSWDKVWWATGFNPYETKVKANNLTANFVVTFNSKAMYDDFCKKFIDVNSIYRDARWSIINKDTYSVQLIF